MIEGLLETQYEISRFIDQSTKRYLYNEIDWHNRLIFIKGARGVGKTTLLLQYLNENFKSSDVCLYVSGDNIIVNSLGLFNIATELNKNGGETFVIDEIHKYPDWSRELKNIYDSLPGLKIIVSGSSSLEIIKGKYDLSRRAVVYNLAGLSFREYTCIALNNEYIRPYTIKEIIEGHVQIAGKIKEKVEQKGNKMLKLFNDYIKFGYYPYFLEGTDSYSMKLNNVIEKVIYEDIPSIFNLRPTSIPYLKKLIYLVATSVPFSPNIARISSNLGVSKEYIYNYIDYLEKAGLFLFLHPSAEGLRLVRKPEKIYLENTNLYFAIEGARHFSINSGALRETFVLNQLKLLHSVFSHKKGDLIVDGKFIFEIGGKTKTRKQIKDVEDSYILSDGIEVGFSKKIPLYLMGMTY